MVCPGWHILPHPSVSSLILVCVWEFQQQRSFETETKWLLSGKEIHLSMPRDTGWSRSGRVYLLVGNSTGHPATEACALEPGATHWARLGIYTSPRAPRTDALQRGAAAVRSRSPPRGKSPPGNKGPALAKNQVKIKLALKSLKWWINKQTTRELLFMQLFWSSLVPVFYWCP